MVELLFKHSDWRIGVKKSILMCCTLVCMGLMSQVYGQTTPAGIDTPPADADCPDGAFDYFSFSKLTIPGAVSGDPQAGEGEAQNGVNSVFADIEYEGSDTNVDLTGSQVEANSMTSGVNDVWTISFSEVLENPVFNINNIEDDTELFFTDCSGNPLSFTISDGSNPDLIVGSAANAITASDASASGYVQITGSVECVVITGIFMDAPDAYSFRVGTCIPDAPAVEAPACADCGTDDFEYIRLTNKDGDGTGATADVELDGIKVGDATVVFSNLSINEDLAGTGFGAFANGDDTEEVLLLRIDFCEAIAVQELVVFGLETESIVSVGTDASSMDATASLSGLDLTPCGNPNANLVLTDGNVVTNMAGNCGNQANGTYTVGSSMVSTLYFKYTNPANPPGTCKFDKTTFKIGTCVAPLTDVAPTCPLTEVTITTDQAAIDAGEEPATNMTETYVKDANGNYFDMSCDQIENDVDNMTLLTPVKVSPCAEVVDEEDCSYCEPTPPCTTCADGNFYEYIDLRNYDPGTGVGDIFLNDVYIGSSEVLPANNTLSISEDLSGKRFGAFANGNAESEMLIMKLEFCEPLAIQQIDILGLEGESQVWVGTTLSGTNVTGGTIDECGSATDAGMIVDGSSNTVINQAGCGNQGDGNYIFSESAVSIIYFKYENVAGGCRYDKTTYRIGVCVPTIEPAIPECTLELYSVVTNGGTPEMLFKDANGLYFPESACSPLATMAIQPVQVSPCATETFISVCENCFIPPVFDNVVATCAPEKPIITKPFTVSVTGLENMKDDDNNEVDFGLNVYLYPAGTTAADFDYPPSNAITLEAAAGLTEQPTVPVLLGTIGPDDLTNNCTEGSLTVTIPADFPQGAYSKVITLDQWPAGEDPADQPMVTIPEVEVIPTMGQWALFILALLMSSLAVVRIRQVKNHEVKELA